jgi:hypothetical protein
LDLLFNKRAQSANINTKVKSAKIEKFNDPIYDGLNINEQNILKSVIDENERSNNWVRLFPTSGKYYL